MESKIIYISSSRPGREYLGKTSIGRMRKKAIVALAAITIAACGKKKEEAVQIQPVEFGLEDAGWLIGTWQDSSSEGTLTETWTRETDTTFAGKTVFLSGKDTAFTENIKLISRNSSLVYATRVSDQNDGKAIEFRLTSASGKQLVFENPEHDYPTKITYDNRGDSVVATISGTKLGVEITEDFAMKKVK